MTKVPFMEVNSLPSSLNTSPPSGVASNLASVAQEDAHFDGITISEMRGNPLYERCDDIDKVGLAQKRIIENTKSVKSKSSMIRQFNDRARRTNIPNK